MTKNTLSDKGLIFQMDPKFEIFTRVSVLVQGKTVRHVSCGTRSETQ